MFLQEEADNKKHRQSSTEGHRRRLSEFAGTGNCSRDERPGRIERAQANSDQE
jgi:ribosomal protein L15E